MIAEVLRKINWGHQPDEVFRVPVRVASLGKEELSHGGAALISDISFIAQGLFYKSVNKYSNTLSIGGKIYPYTYDYKRPFRERF